MTAGKISAAVFATLLYAKTLRYIDAGHIVDALHDLNQLNINDYGFRSTPHGKGALHRCRDNGAH